MIVLQYLALITIVALAVILFYVHTGRINPHKVGYDYAYDLINRKTSEFKTQEDKIKYLKHKVRQSKFNDDYTDFERGVEQALSEIIKFK